MVQALFSLRATSMEVHECGDHTDLPSAAMIAAVAFGEKRRSTSESYAGEVFSNICLNYEHQRAATFSSL